MQVLFLGQEDPLKEDMATHSSIFAWRNPWAEEPGGHGILKKNMDIQSMGSQKAPQD